MKQAMRSQTASCGPQAAHSLIPPTRCRRQRQCSTQAVAIPEIASIASSVQTLVDTIASAAPEPLQPAVQVIGGDIASVAALSPTMAGVARLTVRAQHSSGRGPHLPSPSCAQPIAAGANPCHYRIYGLQERLCICSAWLTLVLCSPSPLQGLYYLLGTAPNPVLGALDFYVATPISNLFKKNYDAPDFALREK